MRTVYNVQRSAVMKVGLLICAVLTRAAPCGSVCSNDESVVTSEWCYKACQDGQQNSDKFVKNCATDCSAAGCFEDYVYGYGTGASSGTSSSFKTIQVANAAECQIACVNTKSDEGEPCEGWQLDAKTNDCHLKTYDQFAGPVSQHLWGYDQDPFSINGDICSPNAPQACFPDPEKPDVTTYDCITCNNDMRCVWHDTNTVSGPRECQLKMEPCDYVGGDDTSTHFPPTTTTTTTLTTTTTKSDSTTTTSGSTTTSRPTTSTSSVRPTTSTTSPRPTTTGASPTPAKGWNWVKTLITVLCIVLALLALVTACLWMRRRGRHQRLSASYEDPGLLSIEVSTPQPREVMMPADEAAYTQGPR